jgi:hypothetical protein
MSELDVHVERQAVPFDLVTEYSQRTGAKLPMSPPHPLFLLASPRSHSGIACAMLGQHPQMYSLPETHLFNAPTLAAWRAMCTRSSFRMADGLLRAVAQLFFGEQTDDSIEAAEGWLRRRAQFSTGLVFEALAERVSPLLLVESSTTLVSRPTSLQRLLRMFPLARFMHLVQHPRRFGEFLLSGIRETSEQGPVPYWMLYLASFPGPSASDDGTPHRDPGFDPQRAWYVLNTNICEFLRQIPEQQKLLLRIEDLFEEPGRTLIRIAGWLGLRVDKEAIEEMQRPERSCFAHFGPQSARFGNEAFFLSNPFLSSEPLPQHTLEGPLVWKSTAQEFLPKVKELARQFGYN